jgi:hypothetical protein
MAIIISGELTTSFLLKESKKIKKMKIPKGYRTEYFLMKLEDGIIEITFVKK